MGGRKIAMIDDADYLNAEGANCLLKTLEEPPPRSVLILIGTSPAKQLPTIRSRCQLIRFGRCRPTSVAELLLSQGLVGRCGRGPAAGPVLRRERPAGRWNWPIRALWAFRDTLFERLAAPVLDSVRLAPTVVGLRRRGGQGGAAPPRPAAAGGGLRRRLLSPVASCRRAAPRSPDDADLRALIEKALERSRDADGVAARLDRCLDAAEQIDRNANQTTLIEAWLDGLAAV